MNPETQKSNTPELSRRQKLLRRFVPAVTLVAAGSIFAGAKAAETVHHDNAGVPSHSYTVESGDTPWEIAKTQTEHGASHTGEVVSEIKSDPRNEQAFKNGQLDPGEVIEVPDSVK